LIRKRGPADGETEGDKAGEAAGGDDDGKTDGAEEGGEDLAQPDRAMRTTATIAAIRLSTASR
jgi:hypothetical protein